MEGQLSGGGSPNVATNRAPPQMCTILRDNARLSFHSTHTRHHTTRSLKMSY